MSEVENSSLRDRLTPDHPSKSGPFRVAPVWSRFLGTLGPYILLYLSSYVSGLSLLYALPSLILLSVLRAIISIYLGGDLYETLFHIKAVDKDTFLKTTLKKFYIRELFIFFTVLISLGLGGLFTMFVNLFDTIAPAQGSSAIYSLGSWIVMLIPFAYVLIDSNEQTLYDKLAGFIVVSTKPYFTVNYPVIVELPSADTYSTVSFKVK